MSRNRQETLTIWSRRLAVLALLILVGGTALFRLGVMSYELPLLGVAISVLLAVLSLFLTLFVLLLQGDKLFKRKARRTLVLCLVVLVIPFSSIIVGLGSPLFMILRRIWITRLFFYNSHQPASGQCKFIGH